VPVGRIDAARLIRPAIERSPPQEEWVLSSWNDPNVGYGATAGIVALKLHRQLGADSGH